MKKVTFIAIILLAYLNVGAQSKFEKEFQEADSAFNENQSKMLLKKYGITETSQAFNIGAVTPSHSFMFIRDTTNFYIDFCGDSLVVGGNLPMSKAAEEFIGYCRKYMKTKIDSLEAENRCLRELYGL